MKIIFVITLITFAIIAGITALKWKPPALEGKIISLTAEREEYDDDMEYQRNVASDGSERGGESQGDIQKCDGNIDPVPIKYANVARDATYLVSIEKRIPGTDTLTPSCTGFAITSISIIAPASCMQEYEPADDYENVRVVHASSDKRILRSESHDHFSRGWREFTDISMITLKDELALRTPPIPTENFIYKPDKKAVLMGFSSPTHEQNRFFAVSTIDQDRCQKFLKKNNIPIPAAFKNFLICAMPITKNYDIEEADMGCPVYQDDAIIGFVNQKILCTTTNVYILTSLLKHVPFIHEEQEYSSKLYNNFMRGEPLPPRRESSQKTYSKNFGASSGRYRPTVASSSNDRVISFPKK